MRQNEDSVDRALESLGSRYWPGDFQKHKLEERIMQSYQNNRTSAHPGRRGKLIAALAVMLLATAGFAATGGLDMVKGWFITVEINGEPVDIATDDIDVRTDGNEVTISLDAADVDVDAEDGAVVTITAVAGDCDGAARVQSADGTTLEADRLEVNFPTNESRAVTIEDANGRTNTVKVVVPDADADDEN